MKWLLLFLATVVLGSGMALLSGCDSDDENTYEVTIAWEIGGVPTCESPKLEEKFGGVPLEFDDMMITFYESAEDETAASGPYTESCDELMYTVQQLDRGNYFVVVEAMAMHQGEELPYFVGSKNVVVPPPDDEIQYVSLRLGKGTVGVAWDFEKGACNSSWNLVKDVKVSLVGDTHKYNSVAVPCEQAEYLFEDVEWDLYTLTIEGFNAAGDLTHRGVYGSEDGSGDQDVDAGADAGGEDYSDRLDVRPGKVISPEDAYVILEEVSG